MQTRNFILFFTVHVVDRVEDGGHPQRLRLLLDSADERAPLQGGPPALAALDAWWGVKWLGLVSRSDGETDHRSHLGLLMGPTAHT